jgi:hypothetical protein
MKKIFLGLSIVLSVCMYGQLPTPITLSGNSDVISFWRNSDSLFQRYNTAIATSGDPSGLQSRMASIISEGTSITNADADELAGYLGYVDRIPLKTLSDSIYAYLDNAITNYSISSLTMDAFGDSLGVAHGLIFPPDLPQNNCLGAFIGCRGAASSGEASSMNGCSGIPAQYRYSCINHVLLDYTQALLVCSGSYSGCVGGGD